jgi:hypothetical protein
MRLLRNLVAIVIGFIAGGITVGLIEIINMVFVPTMPTPAELESPAAMAEFVSKLPVAAWIVVVTAWTVGSIVGTGVAKLLTPDHRNWPSAVVLSLLLLATLFNLAAIPHPIRMWVAGIASIVLGGSIGMCLVRNNPYRWEFTTQVPVSAPRLFEVLSNVETFSKAVPAIQSIEILSEHKRGLETRFRETRLMHGRDVTSELRVHEFEEGRRIGMTADAAGASWETLFEILTTSGPTTSLRTTLVATPLSFVSRLTTPLMLSLVRQGIHGDVAAVQAYCDSSQATTK